MSEGADNTAEELREKITITGISLSQCVCVSQLTITYHIRAFLIKIMLINLWTLKVTIIITGEILNNDFTMGLTTCTGN